MFAMSGRPTQKTIQVEMETETYVQVSRSHATVRSG